MSRWYQGKGNNSDVVLYSKIRLARNLADTTFPSRMSKELKKSVNKRIFATIKSSDMANEFDLINLADVSDNRALSFAEKRLISTAFADNKDNSSFMLSKNENVSIMLCEDDHIRISSFVAGQDLSSAYDVANKIDDIFLSSLNIAYDNELGFLTASPINLGTGLKAAFVLHLPALARRNAIYKLSSMVSKLGLSLREVYKNGAGDLYELSNQVSLGISEKSAIDNVNAICEQIIKQERAARENIKESNELEDKAYRALGVLKMARQLSVDEMLNDLSLVRLGISIGYFDIDYEVIGDMLYSLHNNTLIDSARAQLSDQIVEKLRAQIVREKLN